MFNFFRKKKKKEDPLGETKLLIETLYSRVPNAYGPNDFSGDKVYENLRLTSFQDQKILINNLTELISEYYGIVVKNKTRLNSIKNDSAFYGTNIAFALLAGLLRKKLDYTEEEWINLLSRFKEYSTNFSSYNSYRFGFHKFPITYAIKQIEYYLKNNEGSEKLKAFISDALKWDEFNSSKNTFHYGSDLGKAKNKLKAIQEGLGQVATFDLLTDDIGEDINEIVNKIKDNKDEINQLLNLASKVTGGKPTKKFDKEAKKLQDIIGPDIFRKIAHRLLEVPIRQEIVETHKRSEYNGRVHEYTEWIFLSSENQQFVKGLVWTMSRYSDKETIRLLSKLCEKSFKKIPSKGPAAAALGNACVYVLGNMRGKDGLGALSRLKLKVRQNNVKKTIEKHLLVGAKKYNVSVEELKEMAVPDFGLVKGKKIVQFNEYALNIYIEGKKVVQQWINQEGKKMKSVPSIVKNSSELTKKLAGIRKEVREIQKVFGSQKQRIDNQFILGRDLDYVPFHKFYLNHGLVSPISEKLIWTFTKAEKKEDAIFLDGHWKSIEGNELDWIDENTKIRLWHPVNASEKIIVAWREKMMDLEWKQPIKQAFREIYILTDAEINTKSYSNRMASHILKQHQFSSLANLRDWKYSLMGAYDDGRDNETCKKYIPKYKLTAEFWIDELAQDENWNDAGIWLYVSTDQVKFTAENGDSMDLIDVPKLVFTEIMRDVDLFVGVGSVGNDPEWIDNNGERQTNRDYWHSYSFGDLSEIAKTRKTILERLLPRLKKIRDVAIIDGKFLKVKGKVRNYKIHIGSGNILMEPNDQYLCIVPARSAGNTTNTLFIPFEGDRGLSIVLSKAFLLAEDDKITDSTILSQIGRR